MEFTIEEGKITGQLAHGTLHVSPNSTLGYRPYELFLSSLSGCSGSILSTILTKKRIDFSKIKITSSSVRNPESANRIEKIKLCAFVYTDHQVKPGQAEKISSLVTQNCGMIQSVIKSIDVQFQIEFQTPNGGHQS